MLSTKLAVFTKFAMLGTLGLALGGVGMFYYQKQHGTRRSIASIGPYQPRGLVIGKQLATMTIEVVGPEAYPDNNTEVVELVGFITQHLAADSTLAYEWSLPEGVELIQGPLSNSLGNFPMGRPQQVSILVRGFSREKQKLISLRTHVFVGTTPLVASAVIVSRPEDTTEAKVMDLQAQAKAAAEKSN
jgi:hypothetical protein